MGGALLLVSLALSSVKVSGATTCPPPEAVAARLKGLIPADGVPRMAVLRQTSGGLTLSLASMSGEVVGTRLVPGSGSCEALAAASAVVLAAWLLELEAAGAPAFPPAPLPPPPPTPPRATGPSLEVGAGGAFAFDPSGFSLGGELTASTTPGGGGPGGQLWVQAMGPRALRLQDATANAQRWSLGLGPHYRLRPPGWKLDLEVSALAALVAASGNVPLSTSVGWEPGVTAGLRALADVGLWFRAATCLYAVPFEVRGPGDARANLPQFEVHLAIGLALGSE